MIKPYKLPLIILCISTKTCSQFEINTPIYSDLAVINYKAKLKKYHIFSVHSCMYCIPLNKMDAHYRFSVVFMKTTCCLPVHQFPSEKVPTVRIDRPYWQSTQKFFWQSYFPCKCICSPSLIGQKLWTKCRTKADF